MSQRPFLPHVAAVVAAAVLTVSACGPGSKETSSRSQPRASGAQGSGVAFASLGYEQALSRARSERKLVMVDVYTDWCGWCKKLDRDVFSDPRVADALTFAVSIRIDAEGDGQQVAERFGVRGFPTILFVDGSGKEVRRIEGYVSTEEMLRVLSDVRSGVA